MNPKRLIFCLFLFIFEISSIPLFAEGNDSTIVQNKKTWKQQFKEDSLYSFRSSKGYFPMLLHNFGEQASAPFHMTGSQALQVAGICAGTVGFYFLDPDIEKSVRPLKDRNPWLKYISPEFTQLGDYYGYGLLAAYGGYSLIFHERKGLHTAVLASQAAITAGVWVRIIKIGTGRMRPGATYMDREYNKDHWFGPLAQFDPEIKRGRSVAAFDAFPSGHTAAAFSIATVFALQFEDKKAVPYIAYSLASLVAVSRLVEHEHWASDLLPGAAIGYACGRQVVKHYRKLFRTDSGASRKHKTASSVYFTNSSIPRIHYSLIF